MNRSRVRSTVIFLILAFSVPGALCLGEQTIPSPVNARTRIPPEPRWLFDNVETDYISTPVLALRKALRDQVRRERDPATLRKDQAAAERAEQEVPSRRDAWVKDTSNEGTFSPAMTKLRKELREQLRREFRAHYPKTGEEFETRRQRAYSAQRALVTLKGTVTDEQGHPLDGVGITIIERHETYIGDFKHHPETNVTRRVRVDGRFRIVCNDVDAVILTFRVKGYFEVQRRYYVPHPPDYLPLENGKKVDFDNIHVEMEKRVIAPI